MRDLHGQLLLLTVAILIGAGPSRPVHAATPTDEKKIEQEIDAEDDGSVEHLDKKPDLHHDEQLPPDAGAAPMELPRPGEPPPALENGTEPQHAVEATPSPESQPPNPEVNYALPEPPVKEPPPEPQPIHDSEPGYDGTTRATTSGRGEPLFDWSKHQGEQEVEHPFRERGLIRITRDREYIYKIPSSTETRAMSFRVGMFHPDRLENPDAKGEVGSTFDDNYNQTSAPVFNIAYEWQLWRSAVGKVGLEVGSGLFIAQGNGHFVNKDGNSPNAGLTPREVFTFILVPWNVGVVYRMQFYHRQMIVPYAEGGGTVFTFGETRDDNKAPKGGVGAGAYAAAGAALNLTYFDPLSRIQLDREYGITAVYLTAEFRQIVSMRRYDFTSNMLAGGFLMEY